MKTITVIDNSGAQRTVLWVPVGSKVKAKRHVTGLDDIGLSGLTFECTELIKGKEYSVIHTPFGYQSVPAIVSESNCIFWVEPHNFEIV